MLQWLNSKKTADSVLTQVLISAIVIAAVLVFREDVEKLQLALKALWPYALMIAGVGTATVAGRTVIDKKLAERGEKK